MIRYNLTNQHSIEETYEQGLLPQRNDPGLFYQDSSCRSNLSQFKLSSENRRILNKTSNFSYVVESIKDFKYSNAVQKSVHSWIKTLEWKIPTSTIKTLFTRHIFNQIYTWSDTSNHPVAYCICLETDKIGHIGYVFYNPEYSHSDLPIRLVLQFVIDSQQKKLDYAYLGRFSTDTGYYKRNMPGFEYFSNNLWQKYSK